MTMSEYPQEPAPGEGWGPQPPKPSSQRFLIWSMVGFIMVLAAGLAFGFGVLTHMWLGGDGASTARASATTTQAIKADGSPNFAVLDEIYKIMKDRFVEPDRIDSELLRTAAINGFINAIGDPFQVYLTKSQADSEDTDLQGQFEGIGATVDQKGGEIVIVQPLDDSPAKKAGIRTGDVVLAINGESAKGLTVRDAVKKIRGEKGTTVKLQVRHPDGKTEELSIVRDTIKQASVRPDKPVDAQGNPVDDVAYVRIQEFTARTPDELTDYLKSIQGKGYKGIIVDLRNNPGGLLMSVQKVAEQFMKNQTILIEESRGGRRQNLRTGDGGIATDMKVVVLVNHNSASASEIFAGAIKDTKRGTVVGETTTGKGTVNQWFPLSDGGKVYVSVAHWLTPGGELIEGKGIKPSLEVKAGDNEDPLGYINSVMYRAVDLIRNGS